MTVRTTPRDGRIRQLTDLIVAGEFSPDAVEAVVAAGLAAYAIDRAGGHHHALDPRLHNSRLVAAARHVAIRRATAGLVKGWDAVGIDTLLFKGFYLAEFVYPEASWRAYSDVDLALRSREGLTTEGLARLAASVAREHGFEVVWRFGEEASLDSHHDPAYNGHELLQLVHRATGTDVDAHRRLVHNNVNLRRQSLKGEALTSSVWEHALRRELQGIPVYVPSPIDAALVGLITARSWSGDRHALRPHDPLDLDMLMRHGGFGQQALLTRARELGLLATTRLFLKRCDLRSGKVELHEPSALRAFWLDTLLVSERGHRGLSQASAAVTGVPGSVLAVLREVPMVARHVARWRSGAGRSQPERSAGVDPDAGEAPAADRRAGPRRLDRRTWRSTQLGVRRALKLLGADPDEQHELALTCAYHSLLRRGFTVTRHERAGATWLAYEGQRLPADQLLGGARGASSR